MNDKLVYELDELIRPLAEGLGLTLWGIEKASGGDRAILRVYIDAEGGVDVDQCAQLSRDISVMLEVEDPIPGRYNLEVSSPGLERPFFSCEQMKGYEKKTITAQLHEAFEGRRKFTGVLTRVEDNAFSMEVDNDEYTFQFEEVKKANLKYSFPAGGKGKKSK